MFQQTTLVGNVGSDAEMKFTPSGVEVASFSVATSEKRKGADGSTQEQTIWWRVTFWRQAAVSVSERVKKGMKILVVGKMTSAPRVYQDKQGNHVASLEITGDTWRIVDWNDAKREIDVSVEDGESIPF